MLQSCGILMFLTFFVFCLCQNLFSSDILDKEIYSDPIPLRVCVVEKKQTSSKGDDEQQEPIIPQKQIIPLFFVDELEYPDASVRKMAVCNDVRRVVVPTFDTWTFKIRKSKQPLESLPAMARNNIPKNRFFGKLSLFGSKKHLTAYITGLSEKFDYKKEQVGEPKDLIFYIKKEMVILEQCVAAVALGKQSIEGHKEFSIVSFLSKDQDKFLYGFFSNAPTICVILPKTAGSENYEEVFKVFY